MGFEPDARRRLLLVHTTTTDDSLHRDLSFALEEFRMSFVPSADLLKDIALCSTCVHEDARTGREGLCHRHRARWNLELCMAKTPDSMGESYLDTLMNTVLATDHGSARVLSALDQQLRALQQVWEAHESGAALLPESVAASVARARFEVPEFLPGSTPHSIQRAS